MGGVTVPLVVTWMNSRLWPDPEHPEVAAACVEYCVPPIEFEHA